MIKASELDGTFVIYKDPAGLVHAGEVVGVEGAFYIIAPDYEAMGKPVPKGETQTWQIHRRRLPEVLAKMDEVRSA